MHVALDQPASDLGAAGTLLKKEIKVASVEADFILKNQLEARLAEIEAATSWTTFDCSHTAPDLQAGVQIYRRKDH